MIHDAALLDPDHEFMPGDYIPVNLDNLESGDVLASLFPWGALSRIGAAAYDEYGAVLLNTRLVGTLALGVDYLIVSVDRDGDSFVHVQYREILHGVVDSIVHEVTYSPVSEHDPEHGHGVVVLVAYAPADA